MAAPTSVVYQNQSGGYSCAQYEQEGYLVPHFKSGLDKQLKAIIVGELRGWGMRGQQWPVDLLDRLRAAVSSFAVYGTGRRDEPYPTAVASTRPGLRRLLTPGSLSSVATGPSCWCGRTRTSHVTYQASIALRVVPILALRQRARYSQCTSIHHDKGS
ncbi:DUF6210 family protein (plasmid) [Streptomyces sp. NBC_01717]|uniref:DUF6210 family protein n=1 Tax=Streptomyces sp. NBC_01717 TaxID=2975918 RepID=UPI002E35AB0A|nr:DUF6210 family protein [Streptomyces sp. NBC_01717]